jgi:hypothetical protein
LQEYLQMSNKIFLNQLAVRRQLETSLQNREEIREQINRLKDRYRSADDFLYQAHHIMNDGERELFNFIKKTTKDMNQFNLYARYLLANNKEFFIDILELEKLYEHLCWWQAKYELLKDDPDMCLVYVGVKQGKPFPTQIDHLIKTKIEQLREQALLT